LEDEAEIDPTAVVEGEPGADPEAGSPGTPAPGAPDPSKPAAPGVAPTPGQGPGGPDIQKQALNGTQVTSLVEIVKAVAAGELPVEAGVEIIALAYQVEPEAARKLLGGAGTSFKKEPEPPPAPFGGGPPKPPGKSPEDAGSGGSSNPDDETKGKAPPFGKA
jgi:hypothetical protein